ncbi:hypothetical protein CDAR_166031 [Caerostris darwini]|uniref:Uncharacterized protein n=1 Tax=Caerostris darwini TaxID=1538125 RepID=A0AAV4RSR1_9ARAC|nr:hypothetical protein CDAR_166031 [Caerostris darwini]
MLLLSSHCRRHPSLVTTVGHEIDLALFLGRYFGKQGLPNMLRWMVGTLQDTPTNSPFFPSEEREFRNKQTAEKISSNVGNNTHQLRASATDRFFCMLAIVFWKSRESGGKKSHNNNSSSSTVKEKKR